MAKRRRRETPSPSTPSPPSPPKISRLENQMRGLIEAARAPRARRFVTPAKVQSQINATIQREVFRNEITRKRQSGHDRSRTPDAVSGVRVSGRNALHKSSVLRARLPQQVRDVLLDSERALECTRRETRREVMFALRRAGKNGRKNRKARWTADSRISCKGR